jgi:hypothetical protein
MVLFMGSYICIWFVTRCPLDRCMVQLIQRGTYLPGTHHRQVLVRLILSAMMCHRDARADRSIDLAPSGSARVVLKSRTRMAFAWRERKNTYAVNMEKTARFRNSADIQQGSVGRSLETLKSVRCVPRARGTDHFVKLTNELRT